MSARKWATMADKQRAEQGVKREMIRVAKSRPCIDCGNTYPSYVMDFAHRDRATKLFNIGECVPRYGMPRLLLEIAKCDVVCSNCHRERTHQERESIKKEDTSA